MDHNSGQMNISENNGNIKACNLYDYDAWYGAYL